MSCVGNQRAAGGRDHAHDRHATARRLVPARSGRYAEYAAANRARGPRARINACIGTGNAKDTDLARLD